MEIKTAEEIISENFKGLDDCMIDSELAFFYKGVIKECMIGFAKQFIDVALDRVYISSDKWNPIVTAKDLQDIKQLIK